MVVVALLVVVVGQAMLASGQVRMARLDQQVLVRRQSTDNGRSTSRNWRRRLAWRGTLPV